MKDRQDLNNSVESLDAFESKVEQEWNKSKGTIPQLDDSVNDDSDNIHSINTKRGKADTHRYGQYFMLDYLALRNS